MMNRSLIWYLAIFTSLLAIARANGRYHNVKLNSETAMQKVGQYTHYFPDHWRGKCNTQKIRREFTALYQPRIMLFFHEILNVLSTPFILYNLTDCSEQLCEFIREYTDHVEGVGDICSFARFDFERFGDPTYTNYDNIDDIYSKPSQPSQNPNNINLSDPPGMKKQFSGSSQGSVPSNTTISDENVAHRRERGKMSNGKLENSFLTFAINNPNWQANGYQTAVLQNMTGSTSVNLNNLIFHNNVLHPQITPHQQQHRRISQMNQINEKNLLVPMQLGTQVTSGLTSGLTSANVSQIHSATTSVSNDGVGNTTNSNNERKDNDGLNNDNNDNDNKMNENEETNSKEQPLMSNIFPSVPTPPSEEINKNGSNIDNTPNRGLYAPLNMERAESGIVNEHQTPANMNRGNINVTNSNIMGRSTAQLKMSFSTLLQQQAQQRAIMASMASIPSVPSMSQFNNINGISSVNNSLNTSTATMTNIGLAPYPGSMLASHISSINNHSDSNSLMESVNAIHGINGFNTMNQTSEYSSANDGVNVETQALIFNNIQKYHSQMLSSMAGDNINNGNNMNNTNHSNMNNIHNMAHLGGINGSSFGPSGYGYNMTNSTASIDASMPVPPISMIHTNHINHTNHDELQIGRLSEIDESVNEKSSSQNAPISKSQTRANTLGSKSSLSRSGSIGVNNENIDNTVDEDGMVVSGMNIGDTDRLDSDDNNNNNGLDELNELDELDEMNTMTSIAEIDAIGPIDPIDNSSNINNGMVNENNDDDDNSDDMLLDGHKVPFESLMQASVTRKMSQKK